MGDIEQRRLRVAVGRRRRARGGRRQHDTSCENAATGCGRLATVDHGRRPAPPSSKVSRFRRQLPDDLGRSTPAHQRSVQTCNSSVRGRPPATLVPKSCSRWPPCGIRARASSRCAEDLRPRATRYASRRAHWQVTIFISRPEVEKLSAAGDRRPTPDSTPMVDLRLSSFCLRPRPGCSRAAARGAADADIERVGDVCATGRCARVVSPPGFRGLRRSATQVGQGAGSPFSRALPAGGGRRGAGAAEADAAPHRTGWNWSHAVDRRGRR